MSTVRYTFSAVVQRGEAKTKCTGCGKKLTRVVKKSYYRNGFHNEDETREKNRVWIASEIARLGRDGVVCKSCQNKESKNA